MDAAQFDRWIRKFPARATRRHSIVAALFGGVALIRSGGGSAARNRQRRRKKIRRNNFGCVNVGSFCKNGGQCCSGICQGKKGKKRCQAHDSGGCQAGQTREFCGGDNVPCPASVEGTCVTTTGNGAFCSGESECAACSRDADCQATFGSRAACFVCSGCPEGTACTGPGDLG